MRTAPNLPEVDDVTHQVDGVGLVRFEKLQEPRGLGSAGTQVHVGNEEGPHARAELVADCLICQRGGHGADRSGFASQPCDRVAGRQPLQNKAEPAAAIGVARNTKAVSTTWPGDATEAEAMQRAASIASIPARGPVGPSWGPPARATGPRCIARWTTGDKEPLHEKRCLDAAGTSRPAAGRPPSKM